MMSYLHSPYFGRSFGGVPFAVDPDVIVVPYRPKTLG